MNYYISIYEASNTMRDVGTRPLIILITKNKEGIL